MACGVKLNQLEARGVYGINTNTNPVVAFGVYGETRSSGVGIGVYGYASNLPGPTLGVQGESASVNGTGVYGKAQRTGVHGISDSTSNNSSGVLGEASATSGKTYGIYWHIRLKILAMVCMALHPRPARWELPLLQAVPLKVFGVGLIHPLEQVFMELHSLA